jgi:hypothetical protein
MIPTRRKSKIPSFLSFPLGAKVISQALAGVPQVEALAIEFRFSKDWRQHGFDKPYWPIVGSGKPFPVLAASLVKTSPTAFSPREWVEQGLYGSRSTIWVEAVPRLIRHQIEGKLISEALPRIRQWLIANAQAGTREGGHHLTFFYDELANELAVRETSSVDWHTARL